MLDEIIKLIKNREYIDAETALRSYINFDDAKIQADAYYLLGYINTCWDNKHKDDDNARRFLLYNINSKHSHYNAYVLYARLEEDKNIAEKYLNQGLIKFPNHPQLLYSLLVNSHDKASVIERIVASESSDFELLSKVIEVLIAEHKWGKIRRFIVRIPNNNTLGEEPSAYLNLLSGFAYLFGTRVDYTKAIELLERAEKGDLNNQLGYSHYLGLIYSHIKNNSIEKAIAYFDKLPINNSIFDLTDGPWCFIPIDFCKEYKEIFDLLDLEFKHDLPRRKKARCLFSLYLYYPYEMYGICRYQASDINRLKDFFNEVFNKHVAAALVNMCCFFRRFDEANSIYLSTIENDDNIEDLNCSYNLIVDNANKETLQRIVCRTIEVIENSDSFNLEIFMANALDSLVDTLQKNRLYADIAKIGECFSVDKLCSRENAFYFAYSYNEIHSKKGFTIYNQILKDDPDNSSVLNNIGVIWEEKGDYAKALAYFEKAAALSNEELHIRNVCRIKEKIEEQKNRERNQKQKEYRNIAKNIKLDYFEKIGYDDNLISKFSLIQDEGIRNILLRDLKECAIAIATNQVKSATIMAGSIIEALLYTKLKEKGITAYDVSKGANIVNRALKDMALADFLFVAEKEKLIAPNNIHLSHYVRDYRNFIHPAKEIRTAENMSQENVMTVWTILKRLINELL